MSPKSSRVHFTVTHIANNDNNNNNTQSFTACLIHMSRHALQIGTWLRPKSKKRVLNSFLNSVQSARKLHRYMTSSFSVTDRQTHPHRWTHEYTTSASYSMAGTT